MAERSKALARIYIYFFFSYSSLFVFEFAKIEKIIISFGVLLLSYSKFAKDDSYINPIQKQFESICLVKYCPDFKTAFTIRLRNE